MTVQEIIGLVEVSATYGYAPIDIVEFRDKKHVPLGWYYLSGVTYGYGGVACMSPKNMVLFEKAITIWSDGDEDAFLYGWREVSKTFIKIKGTKAWKHSFYGTRNHVCIADKDFPPMVNVGWNVYEFSEDVEFVLSDMPLLLKQETDNYAWYEANIYVMQPNGKRCHGYYFKTVNKQTGEVVTDKVDFS